MFVSSFSSVLSGKFIRWGFAHYINITCGYCTPSRISSLLVECFLAITRSTPSTLSSSSPFSKDSDSWTSLSWDTNLENWGAKYLRIWGLGKPFWVQFEEEPFINFHSSFITWPEEGPKFSQLFGVHWLKISAARNFQLWMLSIWLFPF